MEKGSVDTDSCFRALTDPYRRQLLVALLEHNPQDDDNRDPLNIVDDDLEPNVLKIELIHRHLPLLEEMGYIQWDRNSNQIRKGPNWEDIKSLLTLIYDHQDELPDNWL